MRRSSILKIDMHVIPDPRATLQQRIPSAILKIVFRPILFFFCFLNVVWALASGGFRIVSDTLVKIILVNIYMLHDTLDTVASRLRPRPRPHPSMAWLQPADGYCFVSDTRGFVRDTVRRQMVRFNTSNKDQDVLQRPLYCPVTFLTLKSQDQRRKTHENAVIGFCR